MDYFNYINYSSDFIDMSYMPPTWMLYNEYVLPHPEHMINLSLDIENIMCKSNCSYIWYNSNRNVMELWAEEELSLYLAWNLIDQEIKKLSNFTVVKKIISWADDVENASDDDFYISIDQ